MHKQPPWLVVDVNGVGYELEAPMSTFYDLPELGREVSLFTHYAQKEDSVSLYGFLREAERRLFRDVQRVTGIGAKIALAVLSGVQRRRVRAAGADRRRHRADAHPRHRQEDRRTHGGGTARPRRRPRRRAGRRSSGAGGACRSAVARPIIALQQLGYKPAEAARMAREAAAAGDDAAAIIRKALKSALR